MCYNGDVKNGMTWENIVWRAAPLLIIIVLISYFAGGGWSAIPSALVAWGTILLAFATFSLVRHSKEQEDRRRQEEQAKEKRDIDERLLNEIIEWAIDVLTRNSPPDILKNPEWVLEAKYDTEEKIRLAQIHTYMDLINQYTVSYLRGEYISLIASRIRNDLGKAVDDLIGMIEKHCKVLQDGAEHTVGLAEYKTVIIDIISKGKSELRDGLSEDAKYQLNVFDDRIKLNKSATKVIRLTVGIKTEGID